MTLDIRIPGSTVRHPLYFLDDTGATHMHIFQGDLDLLHTMEPNHQAPGLGWVILNTSNGNMKAPSVLLEAALFSSTDVQLIPWTTINAVLYRGSQSSPTDFRLSGIWWRHMIGIASLPDDTGRLHLATERKDFDNLPDFDRDAEAAPPPISWHAPAAAPPAPPLPPPLSTTTNWASGSWAITPAAPAALAAPAAPAATGAAGQSRRRGLRDRAAKGLRKIFK